MNASQALPREIIQWLDSLDLAYQVRNVRRDLANGFVIAEILSRYFPREVNIYTYDNGQRLERRRDNWEQISKLLLKKSFLIAPEDYEPIYNQAPEAAFVFLQKLYEFTTRRKLNQDKKPKKSGEEEDEEYNPPAYLKPTGATLARDRELTRITDNDLREARTKVVIAQHEENIRQEKQNSNIKEYLTFKKRQQLEEQLRKEEEMLLERKKKYNKNIQDSLQPEVREIQLKSYNSSTSKKNKEQQGQLMEAKGILDFLQDQSSTLFKKEPIALDLKNLGIDEKKPQLIVEIFNRCDEVRKKSMKVLLQSFIDNNIPLIIDTLNNNFLDFKKFFFMFIKPLNYLSNTSKTFIYILSLFRKVASALVESDAQSTQMMFENILLSPLLDIIAKHPTKKESLCDIIYRFCSKDSTARLHMIKQIQHLLNTRSQEFVSILAQLITQNYEDDFDVELYRVFFTYSIRSLTSTSPITRVNALKILNEICFYDYIPVLSKIQTLNNLINDDWWEVKAQILIICQNLLLYLAQEDENYKLYKQKQLHNQSHQKKQTEGKGSQEADSVKSDVQNSFQAEKDDFSPVQNGKNQLRQSTKKNSIVSQHKQSEENEANPSEALQNSHQQEAIEEQQDIEDRKERQKYLMNIVYSIFDSKHSQNILRIGLIYLAPVLNFYPNLCNRYLDILLKISPNIRESVLLTNPTQGEEEGQIVGGCNSFKYKLTSAPISWNSVGIAEALNEYVHQEKLKEFSQEHLEIIIGCLHNTLLDKDSETWISIFNKLKNYIFLALLEREMCSLASEIIKRIFLFQAIQLRVMQDSKALFLRLIDLTYDPDTDQQCQENLLDLFEFLNSQGQQFKNYNYNIIKQFSEQQKDKFLRSNLVEFMNGLARERRQEAYGDSPYN
ncbi:hypothetical protein ABPG72_007567 [Tetrahymena utriculariae]